MSLLNTLMLAMVMASMLYSKYHGVLIIFFTLLSNPKLLLRYQAWLAAAVGALLFTPHLYWQYTHGFPSVQFHLFERNASSYNISFTLEYLFGQVLLAGPLLGWLILWAALKHKPSDLFEKGIKVFSGGVLCVLLISTFKGRVEANWTIPAFVPLVILSHQYFLTNQKRKRLLFQFVPVTLVLVLGVRVYMMLDVMPMTAFPKDEFHYNNRIADSIYTKTKALPAVFINSYQKASKYWFYSGVMAYSLNTPTYRRNNFNFWPVEDSLLGKKIAAVDYTFLKNDIGVTPVEDADSIITNFYYSFSKVKIDCEKNIEITNKRINNYALTISSEDAHLKAYQSPMIGPAHIECWVLKNDKKYRSFTTNIKLSFIKQRHQTLYATSL